MIYNNTATNITNLAGYGAGILIAPPPTHRKDDQLRRRRFTRFLEKGTFFKLRNVTLRYNVGNVGKYLKSLTAFVSGSNLLVMTVYRI